MFPDEMLSVKQISTLITTRVLKVNILSRDSVETARVNLLMANCVEIARIKFQQCETKSILEISEF